MICNICGNKINKGNIKCEKCGNSIGAFDLCGGYSDSFGIPSDITISPQTPDFPNIKENSPAIMTKDNKADKSRTYKGVYIIIALSMAAVVLMLIISVRFIHKKDMHSNDNIAIEQIRDYDERKEDIYYYNRQKHNTKKKFRENIEKIDDLNEFLKNIDKESEK